MAEDPTITSMPPGEDAEKQSTLGSGTYEIIRQRLTAQGSHLRERMSKLDSRRKEVFGSIESKLLKADRIHTAHHCIPQDMVQLGHGRFLFGFNVRFALKKEIELADVFAVYHRDDEAGEFHEEALDLLAEEKFLTDFKRIYNVYERTFFTKFSVIEGNLYMVFQTGKNDTDIAVFKWGMVNDGLQYLDGRAETDYRRVGFPPQHGFVWKTPDRESYRYGDHPHISIEDRVFVECVGGNLTVKVEDNTSSGHGIYNEPVDDRHQKVDDAEVAYASLGPLIVFKIRPYKEKAFRYLIFNEKLQSVKRVDSIGDSCAMLPEDHGLIFPDGYYLTTGELKLFGSAGDGHVLERTIHAPNGEDSLFVFYTRTTGEYVLLPYRLISQKVDERITCHGFSLFPNGHLVLFRADNEPRKHHMIQLRQTPFHLAGFEPEGQRDAFLYSVGNREVVRCLAECTEVLALVRKDEPYAEMYADIATQCALMLDAYPWLSNAEGFGVDEALRQLREVADRAVDEFDKVQRLQREAVQKVVEIAAACETQFADSRRATFQTLEEFVHHLAALRRLTGELITLKDERYIDVARLTELEKQVGGENARLSQQCVGFLLKPEAMDPYRAAAEKQLAAAEQVSRVTEARKIEESAAKTGTELEMLIEIVNNLGIEDATETTRIIDGITGVYTLLNQVRGTLRNRMHDLQQAEGTARFAAQMKLLGQSAASYLDLCDTPAKCEEYLNRISVQIEEMEGTFSDFDEFIVQITERRTELYEAFEQRKVALVEARNRRATALMTSAERILKVVQNRLATMETTQEINTYLASDVMIGKLRETIQQLMDLEDTLKADDLSTRLRSLGQEAVRQLKDRQELFTEGPGVIRLGRHSFNVNSQPLDLTTVQRDGKQFIHITGTRYFEEISDPGFLATRDVWDQEFVSGNQDVYRAETLAWKLLREPAVEGGEPAARLKRMQEFMAARYQEGYVRGIHDLDGEQIFAVLHEAHISLGLARFRPEARACALVFWHRFCPAPDQSMWRARVAGFAERNRIFPGDPAQQIYIRELKNLITAFLDKTHLFDEAHCAEAAEYLFLELTANDTFVCSREADALVTAFRQHLVTKAAEETFATSIANLESHPTGCFELVRDWLRGYCMEKPEGRPYLDEAAAILFCGDGLERLVITATASATLTGMKGTHARLDSGNYEFDYLEFRTRMEAFEREVVPKFQDFHDKKQSIIETERKRLRLHEFKPQVLTSFVRNQLIDEVYLPLVGDNMAKQLGAAGDNKRTDRSGLLLLVSPPGYGKTTLLEYISSRLGIQFVKINGPAIGHTTTSLDPEEAPNAAAREEIIKLNLSLEMGDNVMICVDDIQHCSSEFLQKFISLCDAQRRIEGVWRGQPRTHDFRGRKVAVVMAGNPYTETGARFRLPDMLANRADTYNLGDIIGGNPEWFKASYIENAVTSNPVLAPLSNRSQKDIRVFLRMAATGERVDNSFEGSYSSQEVEEVLSVLKKLIRVREVILAVNQEYIRSAAQSDEFRTEPAFKLQGSYRNMNRLAEKVVAIMNDQEVEEMILDHYRNESQTLTSDAEFNLLRLREIVDATTEAENKRLAEIRSTFSRNQLTRNVDESDPMSGVIGQLAAFHKGMEDIQKTILQAATTHAKPQTLAEQTINQLREIIAGLRAVPVDVEIKVQPVEHSTTPHPGSKRDKGKDLPIAVEPKIQQGD